ncbi:MAG: MFS transporter [Ktedonobacterales bacterium]
MAAGTGAGVRAAQEMERPAHTRWNFAVLGADMAFFSLGLGVSSAYTLLPLFVHHLTNDNVAVALIPAIRSLGLFGPQLLVAPLVEKRRHAMPFILTVTILERVPYLILALATLWLAAWNPGLLLAVFFAMIFVALLGGGLTYPAWLDMIARAIPKSWLGRFMGFWGGLGGVMSIGGAAIAALLVRQVAWPLNFALCFLLTFGAVAISFGLLALGREPERVVRVESWREQVQGDSPGAASWRIWLAGLGQQGRELRSLLRSDGGLVRLIAANALIGIATMAGALFTVAAVRSGGLSDADVGVESTVLFVAMTAGSFLWGTIGDRFGHRFVLVWGALCTVVATLFALGAHGFWAFAVIFTLLGLNLSAVNLASFTLITEYGPEERRPTYVALANVAYAPFAIGAPILGGAIADWRGYTPVFVISALAALAAAAAFQFWVPDPRSRKHSTVVSGSVQDHLA